MEILTGLLILIGLLGVLLTLTLRQAVIFEHERGVLYRNGKFQQVLEAGRHWYFQSLHKIYKVDMRARLVSINGQEVLSSDNVSLKISLVANFKVADPYRALQTTVNYQEALYLFLQVQLRDLVASVNIDDLLTQRKEIGELLLANTKVQADEIGLTLSAVNIKDVMFPGELKNIFAQVVNARKEGLAALERARGESAALRNLSNAAQLLENNPALMQLRLLQTLNAHAGNTVVLKLDGADEALLRKKAKAQTR